MSKVLVFDIETVPDVVTGRRLYDLGDLPDGEIAKAMAHLRQQKTGNEFLPPHLQCIVSISVVMADDEQVKVWSLGQPDSAEADLVKRFFDGVQRYQPVLVSWNGSGFDLPVLHYRALLHSVQAPMYWELGDMEQGFRWNNYISRFHWRHIDLMDVLAGYQPRSNAPLDEVATLLGLPGKMGMDGSKVWASFQAGDIIAIRQYCETDVLNTYLIYLRFELMRGRLLVEEYQQRCQQLRSYLVDQGQVHFDGFVSAWDLTGTGSGEAR